ncbi:hypothetical protein RKD39_002463 [Streptomyces albogriseolus]
MRSTPSRCACSSRWCSTSCGGRSSPASVWAVVRSWPMIAADVMEWPITSPTTRATRLPGSGIASYQSPPTRAVSAAGRYRDASRTPVQRGRVSGSIVRCSSSAMYASRPYSTALSMPRALCVASCAATSRSSASNGMRSGRRRNSAAPITRRRPRSGARTARWPSGTAAAPSSPRSSGSAARAAGASVNTGRTPRSTSASALPGRTVHSSSPTASSSDGSGGSGGAIGMNPPLSVSRSGGIRSVRRNRSTSGPVGRSSPTGSGSRRYTRIASEKVGTVARHSPITISSRSMPRAIRRVAAPTKRSRSPSRRIGVGRPGRVTWPVRRSVPPGTRSTRPCPSAGCTGMPSGAGRGRCASGSASGPAPGCECSDPGTSAASGARPPGAAPDAGGSPPERPCAGKAAPVPAAGAGERRNAPRGSAGSTPGWGRSKEVGCSVTRVESIRPAHAVRAVRSAETPIPGTHAPGTDFACGQRLFLRRRPAVVGPCRCFRTPRSRPAAPR